MDAVPRRVVVEEEYFLEQEISERRSIDWARGKAARGSIEWQVPFDGPEMRRIARSASARARLHAWRAPVSVGRLAVADHEATDLADVALLRPGHDTVPLTVPTHREAFPAGEYLAAGRYEVQGRVDYGLKPGRPALHPVKCWVDVNDPDTAADGKARAGDVAYDPVSRAAAQRLVQYGAFQRGLEFSVAVEVAVDVPRHREIGDPVVRRVSLTLPHLASADPSSLSLTYDRRREPFQHHAPSRGVEWTNVATVARPDVPDENGMDFRRRRFDAGPMSLAVGQPGELFETREVVIHTEVELPGYLLSGAEVRLFDAAGRLAAPERQPVCRTIVHSQSTVMLDDAFARRWFSPYQSIVFDEIVPEPRRVSDVVNVLHTLGFDVHQKDFADPDNPKDLFSFLSAVRGDGPTTSRLAILVRGREQSTERRSKQGPDLRYSSRLESGELVVEVKGWTRGDVGALVRRMNELHRTLRDRFRPLRSRR
ncbi:hypothetical protein [Actinomycetospora aeridis]|uniref:Uncharacterized protein n=1 Tax=Actinomycetospora aeridis TaxID=3129231 RepID=A0ABU8N6H7_9PSEU